MPGKNIVLEPGTVLFRKGEKPNGMYLVRSGELKVYLDDSGQEVTLAQVPTGGMIGEMALFDQKPRSASVKAITKTEVTSISEEDFKKLTTQIPKWFTTLMAALVGRLRTTNDRLQELESKSPTAGIKRIIVIQRILFLLDLVWHQEGDKKSGKEWSLEVKSFKTVACEQCCEDSGLVDKIINILTKQGFYEMRKNEFKNDILISSNRGDLTRILGLLCAYTKKNPRGPLSAPCVEMLEAINIIAQQSGYDVVTVNFSELEKVGKEQKMVNVAEWSKYIVQLNILGEDIKTAATPQGDTSIKARKKDIKDYALCHKLLAAIYDSIS
jgi:CRP/FNR family cyclic AMP-dependent transcriptional regulator